jgi:hypothetical protein
MIDTHHPPAPGGPALPSPRQQPQQPAEAARAAAATKAVFTSPDAQPARQRQAAGTARWEDRRLTVFARAATPERSLGLIKDE